MRRMVGLTVAVLVCLAAGAAYAAYNQAMGTLKSVDAAGSKIVVSVMQRGGGDATDKTFLVDKDATIRIGQDVKTLADLTEGTRVSVTYKEAAKEGDPGTALLITVMPNRGGMGGPGAGGQGGGRGNRGGNPPAGN